MDRFCGSCGARLDGATRFCGGCGAPVAQQATAQQQASYQQQSSPHGADKLSGFAQNTKDETSDIDPADIEKNKVMGGLAYFIFFLPLLVCPTSRYGRFHANQALLFVIFDVCCWIVFAILSAILWRLWWLTAILSLIIGLGILVLGVIGLINGFTGKAKELPLIGKFRIIKH